jgi:hypothetical protein
MKILLKMPEVNKISEIFREAFLKFKKLFCVRHIVLIFLSKKKGSLNSIAVRIRVNSVLRNLFQSYVKAGS